MPDQDHFWSQAAADYETEFIDPYRRDVRNNPVKRFLYKLRDPHTRVVADLGCGIGPLLPFLSRHYRTVYAVDFAEGMLQRARERVQDRTNIQFVQARFDNLSAIAEPVDVAVAVNSLVQPTPEAAETALLEIRRILKPDGVFLGILPAMDAVHYYTMLLLDRAGMAGRPVEATRKNVAHNGEHALYDFAFGQFRYRGIEQHFWQPFEVAHRFGRTGFTLKRLKKVHLSWTHFAGAKDLKQHAPPWDWFFLAKPEIMP
jgi:SAM-dependent methyltransferase